jgi:tyrosinase
MANTIPGQDCPIPQDFTVLEFVHGNIHIWVGGDMLDQSTSANDPSFFLHHSFVDLIWQQWRENHQSPAQRENEYPEDNIACSNSQHFRNEAMMPFDVMFQVFYIISFIFAIRYLSTLV